VECLQNRYKIFARRILLIFCLAFIASPSFAEVADIEGRSKPYLNMQLRRSVKRLETIEAWTLNDLTGPLALSRGGTGAALSDPGADRMMFWDDSDSAVEWLEPGDNLSITGNKLNVADSANDNTSNVLFQYQASLEQGAVGANDGEVLNNTLDLTGASTPLYRFFMSNSPTGSRVNVFTTKWIKISGIDTITFWAEAWCDSGPGGGRHATVKLDLTNGGENANATADGTVDRTTPEWISQTLDVSSLTDGLVFEVTVSISIEHSGTISYMGSFIAFGS